MMMMMMMMMWHVIEQLDVSILSLSLGGNDHLVRTRQHIRMQLRR